ncbi:hypothetical protein ACWDRR_35045 [Kitasatospora sp. NPDC003701]
MTAITVRPGRLRGVAEEIGRSTGLRAQIVGGTPVTSPTRRGKHGEPVPLAAPLPPELRTSALPLYAPKA